MVEHELKSENLRESLLVSLSLIVNYMNSCRNNEYALETAALTACVAERSEVEQAVKADVFQCDVVAILFYSLFLSFYFQVVFYQVNKVDIWLLKVCSIMLL